VVVVVVADTLTTYVTKLILDMLVVQAAAAAQLAITHQVTEQVVVAGLVFEDKETTVRVATLVLDTEHQAVAANLAQTALVVAGASLTQTVKVTALHVAAAMAVAVAVAEPAKAVDGAAEVPCVSCGALAEHIRQLIPAIYKIGE
jgi:hypothetical protein